MNNQLALITGASSGIGMHLAAEFARHGHPLALIAPVEEELISIARTLRSEHGVDVNCIACDLRNGDSAAKIAATLPGIPHVLVNNAGHGQKGHAWEIPLEQDLSMVQLNVEAMLRLTKQYLPGMVARRAGKILNTASIAGFQPGPGYAVYAATKAFVLSYTESLATELTGTGVTATALCPGPTDTDFFAKANMENTRSFHQANLMAPQDVAAAGYKAVMAGDRIVVPGVANKAMVFSRRFLPEAAQARIQDALTDDVPPDERRRQRGDKEQAGIPL